MLHRLAACALFLCLLGVPPHPAEAASFDIGLARIGMSLEELRQAAWPQGARLICSGDADLPAKLTPPPHDGITVPERFTKLGVVACGVFAPAAGGAWQSQVVNFADAPAVVWALAMPETTGGKPRVLQVKLWQPTAAYQPTTHFIGARLGQADYINANGARWSDDDSEVLIGHTRTDEICTILTDKRLERLLSQQMGSSKK